MRILNLYAGIGGNRELWGDSHDIISVEYDKHILDAYKVRYPNDTVIQGDAKQYLLEHYKEFDFIWASPPCQTHSRVRKCRVNCNTDKCASLDAVMPDMTLWEIIIFLKHHSKCKWVVENVIPYYDPLITPAVKIDRHLFWANFYINEIRVKKDKIIEKTTVRDCGFNLKGYGIKNVTQVIRNQVAGEVGEHILNCAMNIGYVHQGGLFGHL